MNNLRASGRTGLLRLALVAVSVASFGAFGLVGNAHAGQQIFSTAGTTTFTKPAGVTAVTVDTWGGGGAGGHSTVKTTGVTAGGGGGAYARSVVTGLPSAETGYSVTVGVGGTSSATSGAQINGGNSIFGSNLVVAAGGLSTNVNTNTVTAGGLVANSIGTVRYAGGSSGTGYINPNGGGGGGGSSAGTGANGTNGGSVLSQTGVGGAGGIAPAGGGNGGAGCSAGGQGLAGTAPGGAGGGSIKTGANVAGGPGAAGRVVVNWGPTVTSLTLSAGQPALDNALPIYFDVVFSEDVTGFVPGDVTLGGSATNLAVTNISGSGTTYTITVDDPAGLPVATQGTVTAQINANMVQDLTSAANGNFAFTGTLPQVNYSTATNPTVTINQTTSGKEYYNGSINFTVVFSESVSDFANGDVELSGTATGMSATVSGSGTTYTVSVSAVSGGTVIASIPAGVATGSTSGLTNVASTSNAPPNDNQVIFDNQPPSVTIALGGAQANPALSSPVTFAVTFTEATGSVVGFEAADVDLSGSTFPANVAVSGITGGPLNYSVTVTASYNGTISAAIPAGAATDQAGNTSAVAPSSAVLDFQGGTCQDQSPSTLTFTYVYNPSPEPIGNALNGPAVDLTQLFTATNLTDFTYVINGTTVTERYWNSAAYGVDGPQNLSFVVNSIDLDCPNGERTASGTITVDNSQFNYLIHNSATTASTKWSPNGWGITGGKYGEFTCTTCHSRNPVDTGSNIKRIRTTITAPNPSPSNFPGSAETVVFTSATDGSSSYGDDNHPTGRATSNRICEVCHSATKVHNYNTANNTDGLEHANQSDCVICHKHNVGFKASGCASCHGNPPTDNTNMVFYPSATGALADPAVAPGAHAKHAVNRTVKMGCDTCHQGNNMPTLSDTIQMGIAANATNIAGFTGSATGGTIAVPLDGRLNPGYSFVASDGVTTVTKVDNDAFVCSNLYCHGNWSGNGGTNNSPSWVGTGQAVCGTCHGANTTWPTTGSHVTHAATNGNVKLGCNLCHSSYTNADHLDGNVAWNLATADGRFGPSATYRDAASGTTGGQAPSATFGNCANVYCHGSATPTWGGAAINCDGCHSANDALQPVLSIATEPTPDVGGHGLHYNSTTVVTGNTADNNSTTTAYVFGCGSCHNAAKTTHVNGAQGVNQSAQVEFVGDYSYTPGALLGTDTGFKYTAGTCGANACHQNGLDGAPNDPAVWGGDLPDKCTGCHNNDVASGEPMISVAHDRHVSAGAVMAIKPCQVCHVATIDASNRAVVDKSVHVNGVKDVTILGTWDSNAAPADNYSGVTKECTNVYCHSNGQTTPTYRTVAWTAALGCNSCHDRAGTTTTLSGKHLIHTGTDVTDTSKQFAYNCNVCHAQTAGVTVDTITNPANHIDKQRDIAVSTTFGGSGLDDDDYVGYAITEADPRYPQPTYTCATTNCHGTLSVAWNGTNNISDCSLCHGMSKLGQSAPSITVYDTAGDTSDGDYQVGAHAAHLNANNNYTAPMTCDNCHFDTVSAMAAQVTYVGKVKSAGHFDTGSKTPADVTFGNLAILGSLSPNYNPGDRSCANTYCHGGTMSDGSDHTPNWELNTYLNGVFDKFGDCGTCHASPPTQAIGHTGSELLTDCGRCHNETMTEGIGDAFLDKTKHMDGQVQAKRTCGTCHGQLPPAKGSHPKHGTHLNNLGFIDELNGNPEMALEGTLADWNATNYRTCQVCHDMTTQDKHLDKDGFGNYINSIMGPNKPDEAFATDYPVPGGGYPLYNENYTGPANPTALPHFQSCSNARCHFKPTPDWEEGN